MKMQGADGHHFDSRTIADAHRHLVHPQAPPTLQILLRVTNVSNRSGIKYPGVTPSACKEYINNMYIIYAFVLGGYLVGSLVFKVLGAVALPVPIPFAVVARSARLWAGLGSL